MKNISTILFLFLVVFLASCVSKEVVIPDDIIDADSFTDIMIDVQLKEGMTSHTGTVRRNEAKAQGFDPYTSIYESHGVEAEKFKRTYDFYSQHPDLMEGIYEQVLDSLSKLEAEVKQKFTKDERAKTDSLKRANHRRGDSIRELHRPGQIRKK